LIIDALGIGAVGAKGIVEGGEDTAAVQEAVRAAGVAVEPDNLA
jgi:hypothetical protein